MKVTVEMPKEEEGVNWDVPQLVISKTSSSIIQTDGTHTSITFGGVKVYDSDGYKPDWVRRIGWTKDSFQKFNGKITLENE